MPSLQVVDLEPDNPEPTQVEQLFSQFQKYRREKKEGDEVGKMAAQYKEALKNKEDLRITRANIAANMDIGPTKRLELLQMIDQGEKQNNEMIKAQQKALKDAYDEDVKSDEVQNLVDQGMPVKEAVLYVNSPPSVQNRIMANHIEQKNRGKRQSKVPETPQQGQVPSIEGTPNVPMAEQTPEQVEEWPDIPPPKDMTDSEKVKWMNNNQKENNKELVKTQAKKHAYESNANLIKSMTTVNETDKLPKEMSSLIIDPETGGVRPIASLLGKVNKETQLYAKNLAQFIKGAKEIFGSRVTNFDVNTFMNQLPTLLNSPEGRRVILKQMELTNELETLYNNTLDEALKKYSRSANYADIVALVDEKVAGKAQGLISKIDSVVEASNYMDTMAKNPEKFKGTVLMRSPEGKFKAVRKDKVDSAPEGWSVY